jgi:protein-disulfide isomerase
MPQERKTDRMSLELDSQKPVNEAMEATESVPSEDVLASSNEVLVIKRTTLNYVVIAIASFALGVVITLIATSRVAGANDAENQRLIEQVVAVALDARGETVGSGQQAGALDPNARVEVSADDDPAYGPEDASVVMIEFSDFNCPYCGRFSRETLPLLRENYEGRIRFVYRDYPILGDSSLEAAIAAECANDQGAFWDYHDLLFQNQGDFNQDMFIRLADEQQLDAEQFTTCQNDSATSDEIVGDYAEAQRLGVSGTPTFFINGRRVVGAQPYEAFQSVIDEELASTGEAPASDAP